MDTLKKVVGKGDKANESGPGAAKEGQDYGDKGAEYINKKYMGDKLSADQREQMTDTARQGFENATGKKVPGKLSE
ncbi:hypothetical protein F5B22DRAFT_322878 [Xylaria bambusicola]|uniref:uncharacterized protein n=1 Tax=Xylaria bambusicola TaxID=326684 RepID=UPI00200748EA|nr:uncharacterized protein F5B22DRAFT_322878 [Xylaria bambusicola]KAI0509479.1 hypothetical protein F5B22DRAFT_322878 [Xylaria bambusicola]